MHTLPECDGPGDRVIAVDDRKDSLHELIDIQNLLQMLLTLLGHFQDTQTQEVVSGVVDIRKKFVLI